MSNLRLLFVLPWIAAVCYCQLDTYVYMEEFDTGYYMSGAYEDFEDSVLRCQWNGSALFYPRSREEAEAVTAYVAENVNGVNETIQEVFVGIHDFLYSGELKNIYANDDFYADWIPNQPNLTDIFRPAAVMSNFTKFRVWGGFSYFEAVCMDRNVSYCPEIDLTNYTVLEEFNAAYKAHDIEEIYRGNLLCLTEGALLFYPTSDAETEAVFQYILPENVTMIQVGIHDYFRYRELKTVDGKTDFHVNWDEGQPEDFYYISVMNNTKFRAGVKASHIVCKKSLVNDCQNQTSID